MSGCASGLDFALSSTDRFLYQKLRCHLVVEGKTQFSADDFRNPKLELEKYLRGNISHALGALFARWKHHGWIREVGTIRSERDSNHHRRISVYEFVEEAQK